MTDTNKISNPIRILIVDDHAVVREGLSAFIQIKPDMEVVGEAANGIEALEKARDLDPDVILLDIVMPKLDGIGTIEGLKEQGSQARILVITSFAEDEQIFPAIKAGALGYERELEVLKLIAQGYSNREIGEQLHLSERTVGKYASSILDKLHLANRTQAALYALRTGIANLDEE